MMMLNLFWFWLFLPLRLDGGDVAKDRHDLPRPQLSAPDEGLSTEHA